MSAARKLESIETDPVWEALRQAPLAGRPATSEQVAMAEALLDEILAGRAPTVPLTRMPS